MGQPHSPTFGRAEVIRMSHALVVGLMLAAGYALGELAEKLRLPKVTGYLAAGLLLNPQVAPFVPDAFPEQASVVTGIALAFITFMVGGSLSLAKLRAQGKANAGIILGKALGAFAAVLAGFLVAGYLLLDGGFLSYCVPLALLAAALAAPTDPSATIAVIHETGAEGPVTDAVLEVAAFDDAIALMLFSVVVGVAKALAGEGGFDPASAIGEPAAAIGGAIACGAAGGGILIAMNRLFPERGGGLIVAVAAMVALTHGVAAALHLDELLATMVMGAVVTNAHSRGTELFETMSDYAEEIIFVLFFTLSTMRFDLSALTSSLILLALFVALRAGGMFAGVWGMGRLGGAPDNVCRYTAAGLLPQGGIVIGLVLVISTTPAFDAFSKTLIGVVIGGAVLHELVGPVVAQRAFRRAGEAEAP